MALERRVRGDQILRPLEAAAVWRFLGTSLEEPERLRLQRSVRIWFALAAVLLALPALAVVVLTIAMSNAAHLDAVPGPAGVRRIVLESGTPGLDAVSRMLPGRFHQIEVDTGISLDAAPPALRGVITRGEIRGGLRKPASMPPWAERLFDGLPPLRRAVHLILADRRQAVPREHTPPASIPTAGSDLGRAAARRFGGDA
jgi:hypothetical protein